MTMTISKNVAKIKSLEVALAYLERHPNRYIFPIFGKGGAGKKFPPAFKGYRELASNDAERITAWAKRYPGCTWGMSHAKSKTMVIDVDLNRAKGKRGDDTIAALAMADGYELPPNRNHDHTQWRVSPHL